MNASLRIRNLVKHYFNICNTALTQNKDSLIYGSVIAVINQFVSGQTISLRVVDDSETPVGYFTTGFVDGEFTPIREGEHGPDARFTLRQSFLEEVVSHADNYIAHPEKLDWSWLKDV